jgi:hypothetical protein
MGMSGLRWLAALPDYQVAVVTEDGAGFYSAELPVIPMDDFLTSPGTD